MRLTIKKFLSDSPNETGSIVVTAESPKVEVLEGLSLDEYKWNGVDAQVMVRDCHGKPVCLDFSCENMADVEKRLKKIDVMVNSLLKLRETLPIMMEEIETYKSKAKKGETDA